MKMLRWTLILYISVSTTASAQSLPAGFTVGYDEPWIENNYGNWLASNPLFGESSAFNSNPPNSLSNMFSGMLAGNARIVRIFLFPALQGICINTPSSASCPQGATLGLTSEFIGNLAALFMGVRTYNLSNPPIKLYITALNAGDASVATSSNFPALHAYYQNLFSNSVAVQAYETSVLGPILRLMTQYKDVIYGFDVINEIELAINTSYFSNSWIGARAWIQGMTAFVKSSTTIPPATTSWLPVTSSAGGGYAVLEVTLGLFSGLGLNFYDVHIYSDTGTYSGQTALCSKTRSDRLQIVLGEFGQKSTCTFPTPQTTCDAIQNTATTNFLNGAKSSCFSSALAWKYEETGAPYLSYLYINSSGGLSTACTPQLPGPACPRPAYTIIKNFVP